MLDDILTMLGIEDPGDAIINQINIIINTTTSRLNALLGVTSTPTDLEYIVMEVSIARYNRIGSEGASHHAVSGETLTWSQNDFAPYEDDIKAWLDAQKSPAKGRIRFI